MSNFISKAHDLFDDWVNEPRYSKNMIDFLVEQLSQDFYWLNDNISDYNRNIVIKLAEKLKQGK